MLGVAVDVGHARSREPVVKGFDQTDEHSRRSLIARLLWGVSAECCVECGRELDPSHAVRDSARNVYCSIEHQMDDAAT